LDTDTLLSREEEAAAAQAAAAWEAGYRASGATMAAAGEGGTTGGASVKHEAKDKGKVRPNWKHWAKRVRKVAVNEVKDIAAGSGATCKRH